MYCTEGSCNLLGRAVLEEHKALGVAPSPLVYLTSITLVILPPRVWV